jgi:opacity protein-like surface antigen
MGKAMATLIVALLLGAAPAYAQTEKPVDVNFGGGYTFATGEARDALGDGFNFNAGVSFNVSRALGIQVEYGFNGLGEKNIAIPVSLSPTGQAIPTDFFADANMQFGDVNMVFRQTEGRARGYGLFGVGAYYRKVAVTTPGVGYVSGYCNPYWYACYPGGFVEVDRIVGERSATDFGINLGGGVNFAMGEAASLYVEARWHYIWGSTVTNPQTAEELNSNASFFPITIGLRF